jgi:hypothetical protein
MRTNRPISLILLTGLSLSLTAQEFPLVTDKQGTFQILSRTDYVGYDCGYTKAEVAANLQRITDIVNTVRQNPVLSENKGFESRARIITLGCDDVGGYGIAAGIKFEFSSFFRNKDGMVTYNAIEPPEWSLYINKARPAWEASHGVDAIHGYFTAPLRMKTVEPGIDVYDGEFFMVYDPSRPAYWIPVTVNEAFQAVREFYDRQPDDLGKKMAIEWIDKEYAAIPEEDRDKRAYYGGVIAKVRSTPGMNDQDSIFPYIVKMNPEYWNKDLPRSAIQLINFHAVQNKEYLRKVKEDFIKKNNTHSDLLRFEESFSMDDIRRLVPLIGK